MKAVVFSLGCKVNVYEGQAITDLLENLGWTVSDKPEYADVYILNTCSVTAEADKKSRQAVERLKKFNRNAKILVLGCSAQNDPEKYLAKSCVDAVSGVGGKTEAVLRFISSQYKERFMGTELPEEYEDNLHPASTRTRGYIKIQDGCDNFCSYCRIPYLRGKSRSRSIDSILREASEIARVSKEIVLTGIDVSDYRYNGQDLADLAIALGEIPVRKRLSSLECEIIDERLLAALKSSGFCDHFHLSLQSGSNRVLKLMNRHYTAEEYLEKTELIYTYFPDAAITTDLIAGFPGETEKDHLCSMETARKSRFAAMHVFPYSKREGTEAATMDQTDEHVKVSRAAELIELGSKLKKEFIEKNIGKVGDVYAETENGGLSEGFTSNYIKVYSTLGVGEMGRVKLVAPYLDGVKGEQV